MNFRYLLLIVNILTILTQQNIPLLLLSNSEMKTECPTSNNFLEEIAETFPEIHIFVEKKLSPEDFSSQFLDADKMKMKYCPNISRNFVQSENPKLNWVYFEDDAEFKMRSDMISSHFLVLERNFKMLESSSKGFLILYTGLAPSWKPFSRSKREDATPSLIKNEKFLLYIKDPIVLEISPPSSKQENRLELGQCSFSEIQETQIQLQCGGRKVSLNYTSAETSWSIKSFQIQNENFVSSISEDEIKFYVQDFRAPAGNSFHCSRLLLTENVPKSSRLVRLIIKGLQVQIFDEGDDVLDAFGYAEDCAGFVTIPILMGFFVSAIMLIILGIGVVMMMDIRTNDKFDDPQNKRALIVLYKN